MHELDIREIQSRLEIALKRTLDSLPSGRFSGTTIQRATIKTSGIEPIPWLDAQDRHSKLFWSRRDKSRTTAGCGAVHHIISDSLAVLSDIRHYLIHADRDIRYFGGMRFDPAQAVGDEWLPYAKFRFFVPRFELTNTKDCQTLSINFFISPRDDLAELYAELKRDVAKLKPPESADRRLPAILELSEQPDREQWGQMLETALAAIRRRELEKIVLAGKTLLTFQHPLHPLHLLQQLLQKNGHTFHFSFQFQHGVNFLGMSPECLFQRSGDSMLTEAIASTRPRGKTAGEDARLAREMSKSDKDLREHRWVKKMIVDRLTPFCDQIDETANENLLKLSHVQHLMSEFRTSLRPGVQNEQLVEALHPTPAVGGYPKNPAIERIAQLEPFDRGWYAAPVGWVSQDEAEFAVAIRSALVEEKKLHLFAGSGIVDGSDPHREWEEKRNKAQNFLQLFGVA
ncbi:isochorismate synthase [candidate division KSB1 bacterium]|nr:isochorismate synthase [candidate division KSB1 bacterium]